MNPNLLSREIKRLEKVLNEIEILPPKYSNLYPAIKELVDFSKAYYKDALYFYEKGDFVSSFELINYVWGILETLVKLGFIKVKETIKYFKVDQP